MREEPCQPVNLEWWLAASKERQYEHGRNKLWIYDRSQTSDPHLRTDFTDLQRNTAGVGISSTLSFSQGWAGRGRKESGFFIFCVSRVSFVPLEDGYFFNFYPLDSQLRWAVDNIPGKNKGRFPFEWTTFKKNYLTSVFIQSRIPELSKQFQIVPYTKMSLENF